MLGRCGGGGCGVCVVIVVVVGMMILMVVVVVVVVDATGCSIFIFYSSSIVNVANTKHSTLILFKMIMYLLDTLTSIDTRTPAIFTLGQPHTPQLIRIHDWTATTAGDFFFVVNIVVWIVEFEGVEAR